jgi:hypothetical protein
MHEDVQFRDNDPSFQIEELRKEKIALHAEYEYRIWSIHFWWIVFTAFLLIAGSLAFILIPRPEL